MAAPSTAPTVSTVPVSIRFVLSVSNSNKSEDFSLVTLNICAKTRVAFLRSASVFVLGSSAQIAAARREIRAAIAAPKTSALRTNAENALVKIAALNAKLAAIASYFLECQSLSGQSMGTDGYGNTVTGADLASAMFGGVTVAQHKSLLRAATAA